MPHSAVQSVIFKKRYWSVTKVRAWLKKHGFVWDSKVDEKLNFIRFRQFDPSKYKKYQIKKITKTIELVIGFK